MGAGGLLLGLGLAGGALLLIRRAQSQTPAESDSCARARDAAEALQKGSGAAAYAACKALGALKDVVMVDWAARDAKNRELNGEIEVPIPRALITRVVSASTGAPALRGTALRFKNGCVPFKGAPGWSSCASGTEDMLADSGGGIRTRELGDLDEMPADMSKAFSQSAGDPFTQGPYKPGGTITLSVKAGNLTTRHTVPDPFDVELADGETGWVAGGRPFKCAPGTEPAWSVRDQRNGGQPPPCTVGGESPWTSSGPVGTQDGTRSSVDCNPDGTAPAGFTWTGSGWRRLRVGETPNPGPCSTTTVRRQSIDGSATLAVTNGGFSRMQ